MVYMFLADGFEEVEAICPLDCLRRAKIEVTTVKVGAKGADDMLSVCSSHSLSVNADMPDIMFSDSHPDMIILPGGMPGAKNLDESRIVDTAIKVATKNGAYIAAICAAPMILGKRGLLQEKRAVCYPGFEKFLEGAEVSDTERVVRDGKIITAAGMGVALDFGLCLVSCLKGQDVADEIRKAIIAD
ncbi:MAG: DJ-1 family glyoxalase III [Clostridia bacterium]|nr:DJ-1 family glyoxalase III [Clostridia bacterium]